MQAPNCGPIVWFLKYAPNELLPVSGVAPISTRSRGVRRSASDQRSYPTFPRRATAPSRSSAPARRVTCADGPALAHVDRSDRCPSAPTCRASTSWAPGPSSSARRPDLHAAKDAVRLSHKERRPVLYSGFCDQDAHAGQRTRFPQWGQSADVRTLCTASTKPEPRMAVGSAKRPIPNSDRNPPATRPSTVTGYTSP
jgi:hypothetical protein